MTGLDKSNDIKNTFKQLVTVWHAEQDPFSSVINFEHPAYQAIIEMGMDVVPLILKELQENPDYWFLALQEITKENPVLSEQDGNLDKMTDAWLAWGKQKGLV